MYNGKNNQTKQKKEAVAGCLSRDFSTLLNLLDVDY